MATALITGASNGIGLELAHLFARQGINLILVARSGGKMEALAQSLKAQHSTLQVQIICKDLSLPDAPQEVYEAVQQTQTHIDYLVNNAGFGDFGFFTDTEWAKEAQMIDLNIKALTHLCKLFAPDMVHRGSGKIMNVASVAAFMPGPLMAVYFASKAYVLHLSEALNNELKDHGVSVTALCPGPTETGFMDVSGMGKSKMIQGRKLPSARSVAAYGYKAMMQGKPVAIHGLLNKLMTWSVRITPRNWVTRITRKVQG